jgi:hypothetical protein
MSFISFNRPQIILQSSKTHAIRGEWVKALRRDFPIRGMRCLMGSLFTQAMEKLLELGMCVSLARMAVVANTDG